MRILYSILVLLFFNLSFSQKFEKGYFIENNGNKVECFLDKKYQHYSPDIIKYKLSENDNIKEIDVNSIKELRIYDKVIYYKFNVDMNSSSTRISELDYEKKLRTIKKNILLEIIEKGKINLYLYRDIEGKSSFYYLKDDDSNPELLDYKKYKSGESIVVVSENNDFRNEIYNLVKESNISIEEVENLKYEDRDLIKIIKKYNQINNNSVEIDNNKKENRFKMLFKPRFSFNNSNVKYELLNDNNSSNANFDNINNFSFGFDYEIDAFNNLSIAVSLNYGQLSSETTQTVYGVSAPDIIVPAKIDYEYLHNYIAFRKYFDVSTKSELHLGINIIFDLSLNKSTNQVVHPAPIFFDSNFGFGFNVGYNLSKKYFIEFNYDLNRNLSSNYILSKTSYNNFSLSLMMNILKY